MQRLWVAIACATALFGTHTRSVKAAPPGAETVTLDAEQVVASATSGKPLRCELLGNEYWIDLEPAQLRGSSFLARARTGSGAAAISLGSSRVYRGTVRGQEDGFARLSVVGAGVRGYLKLEDRWIFIEPAGDADDPKACKVYDETAIDSSFHGFCGDHMPVDLDLVQPGALVGGDPQAQAAGEGTLSVLELAVDADVEFVALHGASTVAEIEAILNEVDGIFRDQLGITIEIVSINTWSVEPDPYDSTDAGTLLGEFRNHWNNDDDAPARDLAHLFTGKNLDGSTVGVAYTSVLCHGTFGYGLSQQLGSNALMPILVAHEMGHNLGSGHDSTGTNPRYIMYPSLSSSNLDEFSDDSTTQINALLASVNCMHTIVDDSQPDPGGDDGGDDGNDGGDDGGDTDGVDPGGSTPPDISAPAPAPRSSSGGGPVDPILLALVAAGAWSQRHRLTQRGS